MSIAELETHAVEGVPSLVGELERHGIVVLPNLVDVEELASMQRAFAARLKRVRWNNFDGYEQTSRYRHMIEDVLTLEQGFVDVALHPVVRATIAEYVGPAYELVEAKGWLSLPTERDFHGWHGDQWYDQSAVEGLQREVKLALYLTDVRSGGFEYVKGTHGKLHPRPYTDTEVRQYSGSEIVHITGPAGTAVLFDTSGIHRQSVPMLEPRRAVFYCYHDPNIPIQQEDVDYYRYHPLLLNAAFLGDLTEEHRRVLGFGNKANYRPAFERRPRHEGLQKTFERMLSVKLRYDEARGRARALKRRLSWRE